MADKKAAHETQKRKKRSWCARVTNSLHGSFRKKRNENYGRLVPAGQILMRKASGKKCARSRLFRGVWTIRLIFIFRSFGGEKIYAKGKIKPFALTFPKHNSEATSEMSNHWPLTLAITIPAAPRMSDELRVWCLPMTALSTRTRSDRRSCTTLWRSSRFSVKEKKKDAGRLNSPSFRLWQPSPWKTQLQILMCQSHDK